MMHPSSVMTLRRYSGSHLNCALITPELLLDLITTLDAEQPAGPSFVHALNSLAEAVVLHECLYVVPRGLQRGSGWTGYGVVGDAIASSDFAQSLLNEHVLENLVEQGNDPKDILSVEDVVDHIIANTRLEGDYSYIYFARDDAASEVSFASRQPEVERFRNLRDLIGIKGIFSVRLSAVSSDPLVLNFQELKASIEAGAKGFTFNDFRGIAAQNARAEACEHLAYAMNMNLYTSLTSLPHFISSVRTKIRASRAILTKVYNTITALDEIDQAGVRVLPITPLSQVVLREAKGDRRAIAAAMLELRERHKELRKTITSYEEEWFKAETRRQRREIRRAFDNSWKTLMERESRPERRWVHVVWDILKKPLEAHVAVVDKLKDIDAERQLIDRVKGIRSFWDELENAPIPKETEKLLRATFPVNEDKALWGFFKSIAETMSSELKEDLVGPVTVR